MSGGEIQGGPGAKPALGADLIIPGLAAALTVYFFVDSAALVWEARANGTVLGAALMALIVAQVARVTVLWRAGEGSLRLGEIVRPSPVQGRRLAVVAILVVFVATVPWLGTTLGLFLAMAALMWVLGVPDRRVLLGVAALTAATVYVLFIALLKTQLPAGAVERLLQALLGGG